MGNLGSVRRGLEESGATVVVSDRPEDLREAVRVVLPGVGAYRDGVEHLTQRGWIDPLRKAVLEDKLPALGICLGMQLLSEIGTEGGETRGLALVPGQVRRFEASRPDERIPHVGWNEVHHQGDPIF